MKLKLLGIATALLLSTMILAGCGGTDSGDAGETAGEAAAAQDRECLYQVSLLQDLTQGDYHGSVAVSELKEKGIPA